MNNRRKGRPNGIREDEAAILLNVRIEELRRMCENESIIGWHIWYGKYYIPEDEIKLYIYKIKNPVRNSKKILGLDIKIAIIGIIVPIVLACISGIGYLITDMGGGKHIVDQYIYDGVQKANDNETMIIICDFELLENVEKPTNFDQIESKISEVIKSTAKIEHSVKVFALNDYADVEKYAKRKNASIVIWGQISSESAIINFYTRGNRDEFSEYETIFEAYALDYEDTRTKFYIDNLPDEINFISMYTIGMIYLISNENSDALKYFEYAINELPDKYYYSGIVKQFLTTQDESKLDDLKNEVDRSIKNEEDHINFLTIARAYYYVGTLKLLTSNSNEEVMQYLKIAEIYAPDDLSIQNGFAWVNIVNGNYSKAEKILDGLIENDNNNLMAVYYLGLVHFQKGNYPSAMKQFEKVKEIASNGDIVSDKLALLYLNSGNVNEAIKNINSAIESSPEEAELYYIKSQILSMIGENKEALIYINRAIKHSSNSFAGHDYYLERIKLLTKLGLFHKAYYEEKKLLEIYKTHHELCVYDAFFLSKNRKFDEALENIDKISWFNDHVILNSPAWDTIAEINHENLSQLLNYYSEEYTNERIVLLINHIFEVKQMQKEFINEHGDDLIIKSQANLLAEEYLWTCCKYCEYDSDSLIKIEVTQKLDGEFETRYLIEQIEENPTAYLCRASKWIDFSEYDKALSDVNYSLELSESSSAYKFSAYLHNVLGENEIAKQDIIKAIVMSPNDANLYSLYGAILRNQGEFEESIDAYTTIILLDESMIETYYFRGLSYFDLKEYEKAINDFTLLLSLEDEMNSSTLSARANSYLMLGRFNEAFDDYGLVNSINSENKEHILYDAIMEIRSQNDSNGILLEDLALYLEMYKSRENYIYYYYLYIVYSELNNRLNAQQYLEIYEELKEDLAVVDGKSYDVPN